MNVEQLLYSALIIITGWLGVAVRILWRKSESCESDRTRMNGEMLTLTGQVNLLQGQMDAMRACPAVDCPMRRKKEKIVVDGSAQG